MSLLDRARKFASHSPLHAAQLSFLHQLRRRDAGAAGPGAGASASASNSQKPLFTFGVIADVQYADVDDGRNYDGSRIRRYRQALRILNAAVDDWNANVPNMMFLAQLGDVIDGFCKGGASVKRHTDEALDAVSKVTSAPLRIERAASIVSCHTHPH